ncbi:zinc-binding dehydrogenase [Rhodospirillum rubrum]|uniref:NADPH:quinone oxidoreductase family protein n=1 Tax=Rhodospirillum rubrum TaxID=1085 RepID=UPI00190581F2|nr:NADPH:quinone oxidoreductase family protein [Rhodospirillum rubrum]MBK1663126.1 zinc-binding dehydrogenase [Rhodospirillum rubrum]MBK1675737.1 zinc-binding dehydrogenase [Rhodospirillum rubrum]
MRAMVCDAFGPPDVLRAVDLPDPPLPPDGVRIRVRAAGINFADGLFIAGQYQIRPRPPFIPGFEVAGDILEVGSQVLDLRPGQRVMAILDQGGYADQVVAPARDVHALTDRMDILAAGGFPIAYGTSHFGLTDRCRLRPGEIVLIHGAAGGVGLTAVECAKALGATVIATAGGADRLEIARQHGADYGIDHRSENIKARVRELTGGRGVDVVYDPVGGDVFDASLRCTAPDGRILVVGFASGAIPTPPANLLLVKNITVIGFNWGGYRQIAEQRVRESMEDVVSWWDRGLVTPHVGARFALSQAAEALDALKERKIIGKAVLIPD